MADPLPSTLRSVWDDKSVRRARNARRVGLILLALFVLAGLTGFLGVRTATVTGGPTATG